MERFRRREEIGKKRKNKDMREQERESWQKLIESNRMKTKYPERGRETQGVQGVTWGDGHTEQGRAEPSARPPRRRRNVAQTCTSEDVQQAQTGKQVAPPYRTRRRA